jgi:hypothetical protein
VAKSTVDIASSVGITQPLPIAAPRPPRKPAIASSSTVTIGNWPAARRERRGAFFPYVTFDPRQ